ncbi:MAG: tRNA (5-methylaminomethyl-2-thiouridine)(34)-methyltransferase MnmD, partial [Chitinophagales bacterium]
MKPIKTADGSHTFYIKELDEHYHSIHGALQESMHVFIDAGLSFCQKETISIFEMGLGTGLNAYLTYIFSEEQEKIIDYCGIEAFPIKKEDATLLNYDELLLEKANPFAFEQIHASAWDEKYTVDKHFSLHKLEGKIQDLAIDSLPKFDIIYYDAFAFSAQPELWDIPVLQKM